MDGTTPESSCVQYAVLCSIPYLRRYRFAGRSNFYILYTTGKHCMHTLPGDNNESNLREAYVAAPNG